MNRYLICALALTVFLAGCADTVWVKPSATDDDFKKADYECDKDTRQSGDFGEGIMGALRMKEFYQKCMISKGWKIDK
jgi:hypothetical protein